MSYGMSTRTIASPAGVKQRFAKGVKYIPLSQFFLQKKSDGSDKDALYGRPEPVKKGAQPRVKRRRGQASESLEERYSPQRCMYCDESASMALVYAGGRGYIPCCKKHVNKGAMRIWRVLKDKIHARRRIPKKHKLKEGQSVAQDEGMTSSGTIATTAVPIGPGINHVTDILDFGPGHPFHAKKRRRKKGSSMASKIRALLRRVV